MVRAGLLVALALLAGGSMAQEQAEDAVVIGEDDETLLRSRQIMANPDSVVDRAWVERIGTPQEDLALGGIQQQAQDLTSDAVAQHKDELSELLDGGSPDAQEAPEARFRIFVTQSMSDEELRGIAELVRSRKDVVMVLRGFLPGQDMMQLYQRLQSIFGGGMAEGEFSGLAIDPPRFQELGLEQAPAIAMYDADGQPIGFATGVTNPDWLASQLEGGRSGFRGQNGPVVEIAEEDLIERMQRNARNYDWAGAAQKAKARFFSEAVPSHDLPEAERPRVRRVDPSFVVQEDVLLPDGAVLVPAGTRINPLEHMPFSETVVVFDPTRPAQLEVVHEVIRRNPGRTVKVLASSLASVGDFDGYGRLMNQVGRRVYMLPAPLREQFRIERTPTVVTVDGLAFRVEEIPPSQLSAMEGAQHADPDA